jgi:L-lactate dehydrogenase complex protein LldG
MRGTGEVEFLARVKAAIGPGTATNPGRTAQGRKGGSGGIAVTPSRSRLLDIFLAELSLVGGKGYKVPGPRQAVERFSALVRESGMKRAVIWQHPLLAAIGVHAALAEAGLQCLEISGAIPERERMARVGEADVGITAVDHAVAETGSLVLCSRPGQARAVSLLPPVHVAFLAPDSLVSSLEALSPHLSKALEGPAGASNIVLITGPSRTADIELSLTQGVHGPKEVHVFAWNDETPIP